jgi:hypothetical protein
VRVCPGVIACHWAGGGKLGGQHRPGEHVADGQPTDLGAGLEPSFLDGVDLPELVGGGGPPHHGPGPLRAAWPVDAGPLEDPLEHAGGGDIGRREGLQQFHADSAGAPARVVAFEPHGVAEGGLGVGRGGLAAGRIAHDQAIGPAIAEGAPEVADRGDGQGKLAGDLEQGLAPEMALDDLVPGGGRDGAGHGGSPRGRSGLSGEEIIP